MVDLYIFQQGHALEHGMDYLNDITAIKALFKDADYIGLKTIESADRLEPFLLKMFSYRPPLIRLLYRIRAPLVRLLGFKQDPMPTLMNGFQTNFPCSPAAISGFLRSERLKKITTGSPAAPETDIWMPIWRWWLSHWKADANDSISSPSFATSTGPVQFIST